MQEWVNVICIYLVLGMGIGCATYTVIRIWWAVFDELIKLFKCKKAFVKFIRDNRTKTEKII